MQNTMTHDSNTQIPNVAISTSEAPGWREACGALLRRRELDRLESIESGDTVRQLRTQAGVTQADLARRMGIGRARLSRIERGDVNAETVHWRLVDALTQVAMEQRAGAR